MDKIWEIKEPGKYLKPRKKRKSDAAAGPFIEKNPARAYTLSLLFWGAGQSYNEEHGKALVFETLLIGLIVVSATAAVFNARLLLFLQAHQVSASRSYLFAEAVLLCVLIFWLSVAGNAYRTAAASRSTRFTGIQSQIYPFLCSLLVPGWGQFQNGQPLKGGFFSAVSVFGFFAAVSMPATLLIWQGLDPSDERFMIEAVFSMCVLAAPLIALLWLFSAYDAWKVSADELKKEPLWERIKAANNRRRTQGWIRGVFPQIRTTLLLLLFLAALAFIITRTFPAGFYSGLLKFVSSALRQRGMVILPDIIDTEIPVIAGLTEV